MRRAIAQALSKSAKARQASADAFYLALSGKEETSDGQDAGSATLAMPASSSDTPRKTTAHDTLSPAAIGTTPPDTPATTSPAWKVSTALLLLLLGVMWWNSQPKQQTLAPTMPLYPGSQEAQLANADCSDQPPPAYDRGGHPCIDEQTASLWSFDHDYNGRALGLPPRKMEAAKPEQVALEPGLSGRAIRFVGDEGSRLIGGGPFSLGDRFTIEAWVKPHTTEPLGCGQFLFGTAQLKGSRQCHSFKIASGWGLIMRKVATGQYELMFHYMHRDLSKGQGGPTQVKLGGPAVLEGNRWNQIAIVSDGQVLSVMVNGRSKDYFRSPRIYEGRGSAYLTFGGYPHYVTGVVEASPGQRTALGCQPFGRSNPLCLHSTPTRPGRDARSEVVPDTVKNAPHGRLSSRPVRWRPNLRGGPTSTTFTTEEDVKHCKTDIFRSWDGCTGAGHRV